MRKWGDEEKAWEGVNLCCWRKKLGIGRDVAFLASVACVAEGTQCLSTPSSQVTQEFGSDRRTCTRSLL
jgi:hypothetical protein